MSTPSTYLSRRLVVDRATTIKAIPGWGELPPMLVEPPAVLEPGKVYRLYLNPDDGTASISQEPS